MFEGIWRMQREVPNPAGGILILSESVTYDSVGQRLTSYLKWEQFDADGNQVSAYVQKLELAYLYPGDIHNLLRETGFTDIRIDGDTEGNPVISDQNEMYIQSVKPD